MHSLLLLLYPEGFSETWVNMYRSAWHYTAEDSCLYVHWFETKKYQAFFFYFLVLQIFGRRATAQKLLRSVAKGICIPLYMSQICVWNTVGMILRWKHRKTRRKAWPFATSVHHKISHELPWARNRTSAGTGWRLTFWPVDWTRCN
jgi:hypothetical protein